MKKRLKSILFLSSLVAVPAAINYFIFQNTKIKFKSKIYEHFYKWNFGKVRYLVCGKGEPLLLVHGIGAGASLYEWEKNIDSLSKHYEVYALDLLGFGYSDKPPISYSSYLYISLINDFIKNVIGKPTNIIASSTSGDYAIMAYSFNSNLFKKMLLISPTGVESSNQYITKEQAWTKRLIESPIIGTFIYNLIVSKCYMKIFLKKQVYCDCSLVNKDLVNKYYYPAHFGGAAAKYPIAAFLANYLNINIENQFKKVKIPVHVIWGENNHLNPIKNLDYMIKLNDCIETTIFENAKLLPHVENPKSFYKLCRNFFK